MEGKNALDKLDIAARLEHALLENGQMNRALYEYELEGHIDYWYAGLQEDSEDFVFVVTENRGHVAMVLIMPDKSLYINEEARTKIEEFWLQSYCKNMKHLIPGMAKDLADGYVAVNGVKIKTNKTKIRP